MYLLFGNAMIIFSSCRFVEVFEKLQPGKLGFYEIVHFPFDPLLFAPTLAVYDHMHVCIGYLVPPGKFLDGHLCRGEGDPEVFFVDGNGHLKSFFLGHLCAILTIYPKWVNLSRIFKQNG